MIERLSIPDVWTFSPRRFEDERGSFCETFNARVLQDALVGVFFVQDNQVSTYRTKTLRGVHFQAPPRAQDKLVRVLKGAILDVAVDLRRNSGTYAKWVSVRLTAESGKQIFVPKGFGHAYLTLEPNTEVLYKVSDFYSKDHERGVAWSDPDINIDWGAGESELVMVDRDRFFPRLADLPPYF